jgi:hypothetical protein
MILRHPHLEVAVSRKHPSVVHAGIERTSFSKNAASVSNDVVSKEKSVKSDAVNPGRPTSMV